MTAVAVGLQIGVLGLAQYQTRGAVGRHHVKLEAGRVRAVVQFLAQRFPAACAGLRPVYLLGIHRQLLRAAHPGRAFTPSRPTCLGLTLRRLGLALRWLLVRLHRRGDALFFAELWSTGLST